MSPEAQLAEGLVVLGNDLPASAQQRLLDYAGLLEKWNHTYRLTALSATSLAISHHLLDSLAVLPFVKGATLLDVGSGGGHAGHPAGHRAAGVAGDSPGQQLEKDGIHATGGN